MDKQTKIRPESIVIIGNPSFIAGTYNEYTKAEVDKTNSQPERTSYPFIITAQTFDGKTFEAKGNTSENQAKIAQITNYKVDDKERKLSEPLEVKIEDGKLAADGLKKIEQLINKSSTILNMFNMFGSIKTIESEEIQDKAKGGLKAVLEQANKPDSGFKSAFNTIPSAKPNGKSTEIG